MIHLGWSSDLYMGLIMEFHEFATQFREIAATGNPILDLNTILFLQTCENATCIEDYSFALTKMISF